VIWWGRKAPSFLPFNNAGVCYSPEKPFYELIAGGRKSPVLFCDIFYDDKLLKMKQNPIFLLFCQLIPWARKSGLV